MQDILMILSASTVSMILKNTFFLFKERETESSLFLRLNGMQVHESTSFYSKTSY